MLTGKICAYGSARGFHKETLDRWLELSAADQEPLLELAETLKLGESHFRDLLDWLGEIALRDGVRVGEVLKQEGLSRILSDPRLGRSDKVKALKEELRRLRFPRLSRVERAIQEKLSELKLKPQIQVSVPPGLEGGKLTFQMSATSYDELTRLVGQLQQSLEKDSLKEIFALLEGSEGDAGL